MEPNLGLILWVALNLPEDESPQMRPTATLSLGSPSPPWGMGTAGEGHPKTRPLSHLTSSSGCSAGQTGCR